MVLELSLLTLSIPTLLISSFPRPHGVPFLLSSEKESKESTTSLHNLKQKHSLLQKQTDVFAIFLYLRDVSLPSLLVIDGLQLNK